MPDGGQMVVGVGLSQDSKDIETIRDWLAGIGRALDELRAEGYSREDLVIEEARMVSDLYLELCAMFGTQARPPHWP